MRFLFIALFFVSSPLWAQLQFQAQINDDQTQSVATDKKRDQLFAASLKAMENFSKELGYDYEDFKKKLDEKFEKSFSDFKEQRLKERFGTGKDALTEEQKKEFFTEIEAQRVVEYQKFSRILDTVQSYNMQAGEGGKTVVDLKMDRLKLNRLFKKIISDEKKAYSRIWIIPEINLSSLAWADLGLEKEQKFLRPLAESWQKWVSENLPESVEDVGVCESQCHQYFEEWEQKTVDQLQTGVDNDYKHGVWAKVSLNLKRTQYNPSLNESAFEWEGKLLILDVDTKRTIVSYSLPMESKEWRNLDQKALNSALASRIYRTPLPFFKQVDSVLKSAQPNRVIRLVIKGHKNISDVLALIELMKSRGSSLGLDAKLDKIRSSEAEVLCFFQGEEKSFTDLLSKLKELKSSTSYQLVNEFTGVQHVLKLVHE